MRHDKAQREALRAKLAAFHPDAPRTLDDGQRHAAVGLIVADGGQGEATLLITRRAANLRSHSGQWALPGGRVDAGESAVQAALREAREEINLDLTEDAVLGILDDYPTRSGYLITPVVAWAPKGATMSPNPAEVAHLYHIPLEELSLKQPEFFDIPESKRLVIRLPLRGGYIHAPTAAMLWQFIEVALHGRNTRVADLEQPVWAWK